MSPKRNGRPLTGGLILWLYRPSERPLVRRWRVLKQRDHTRLAAPDASRTCGPLDGWAQNVVQGCGQRGFASGRFNKSLTRREFRKTSQVTREEPGPSKLIHNSLTMTTRCSVCASLWDTRPTRPDMILTGVLFQPVAMAQSNSRESVNRASPRGLNCRSRAAQKYFPTGRPTMGMIFRLGVCALRQATFFRMDRRKRARHSPAQFDASLLCGFFP